MPTPPLPLLPPPPPGSLPRPPTHSLNYSCGCSQIVPYLSLCADHVPSPRGSRTVCAFNSSFSQTQCRRQINHYNQPGAPRVRRERLHFFLFWRMQATHVLCLPACLFARLCICECRVCAPVSSCPQVVSPVSPPPQDSMWPRALSAFPPRLPSPPTCSAWHYPLPVPEGAGEIPRPQGHHPRVPSLPCP